MTSDKAILPVQKKKFGFSPGEETAESPACQ